MVGLANCPICHKSLSLDDEEQKKFFPFCSLRCRQVDLFRWAEGKYAIVEPLTPDKLPQELIDPDDEPE